MLSRRWARTARPAGLWYRPASSGPRCARASRMRQTSARSSRAWAPKLKTPAIPHIGSCFRPVPAVGLWAACPDTFRSRTWVRREMTHREKRIQTDDLAPAESFPPLGPSDREGAPYVRDGATHPPNHSGGWGWDGCCTAAAPTPSPSDFRGRLQAPQHALRRERGKSVWVWGTESDHATTNAELEWGPLTTYRPGTSCSVS